MPLLSACPDVASVTIRRINPLEDVRWDTRLAELPGASFFHGSGWARVLHDTYGFNPVYFVAVPTPKADILPRLPVPPGSESASAAEIPVLGGDNLPDRPKLQALLPVMEVDSWLTGRRGVSLPFTDNCEPLGADASAIQGLFRAVLDHANARSWKYWECRGGRTQFGDVPASTSFWGHRLDLADDESTLFSRVNASARRAIRKAAQSGLTVEFSHESDAVRTFHRLICRTRRRHGVPPQPWCFFQNIARHVLTREQGWVVLARRDRVPVAGAMFFQFGKTVIYKYGASDHRFQHLRANNFVMWEAIKRFAQQGCDLVDFGRTSLDNEGLRRYKLGWGAQERRIDYVRYDRRAHAFVTVSDGSLGWQNRVFRVLPVALSRLVGAALYRHVA